MSDLSFVGVNGLNGSLEYGFAKAGCDLKYRTGYLTLGQGIVNANASLWGDDWEDLLDESQTSSSWRDWPMPEPARIVVGVPPCSGFSILADSGGAKGKAHPRGPDNPTNACMVSTVRYASRHRPDVVMFESVQGAYTLGRQLMLEMRASLEVLTGERYTLTHWLHDGIALGSPTSRKRYLFVAVRGDTPFMTRPMADLHIDKVTTIWDAIGDLETTPLAYGDQQIVDQWAGGAWAHDRQRRYDKIAWVDGHHHHPKYSDPHTNLCNVAADNGVPWTPGTGFQPTMQALYEAGGLEAVGQALNRDPNGDYVARLVGREFNVGAFGARREVYDAACSLVTGAGPYAHIHPSQDRSMTYREVARIQGWPDDLRIDYDFERFGGDREIGVVWGKAVHLAVTEYAGEQVRNWLSHGAAYHAHTSPGVRIGDREWLIDDMPASKAVRKQSTDMRKAARQAQAAFLEK